MQSLTLPRRVGVTGLGPKNLGSALNIAIPVAVAALAASAAYAGADTTFTPALTKFTLAFLADRPSTAPVSGRRWPGQPAIQIRTQCQAGPIRVSASNLLASHLCRGGEVLIARGPA